MNTLDDKNTHKTSTTIHTRQLQQYTQDNYNNKHKTTTTINTRQLQQYKQDNYNNTHKTTTTIHTRQLNNNSHETTYNETCTKVNNTKVGKIMGATWGGGKGGKCPPQIFLYLRKFFFWQLSWRRANKSGVKVGENGCVHTKTGSNQSSPLFLTWLLNPLNTELNPICQ